MKADSSLTYPTLKKEPQPYRKERKTKGLAVQGKNNQQTNNLTDYLLASADIN
jgi:hypothetical protein